MVCGSENNTKVTQAILVINKSTLGCSEDKQSNHSV